MTLPSSPSPAPTLYARPRMRNVAMQPTDFAALSGDALRTRLDGCRRQVVAGTRDGRFDFEYLELEREASIRQWAKKSSVK